MRRNGPFENTRPSCEMLATQAFLGKSWQSHLYMRLPFLLTRNLEALKTLRSSGAPGHICATSSGRTNNTCTPNSLAKGCRLGSTKLCQTAHPCATSGALAATLEISPHN